MLTEEWLNRANAEFSKKNIPHSQRSLEALGKYSIEFDCSVAFDSKEGNTICEWFKANTKDGAHNMGTIFNSTFFYDDEFWSVETPVFYGAVELDPYDFLSDMLTPIIIRLASHSEKSLEYVRHWADCCDFGLGFDGISKTDELNSFGKDFLNTGYEELSSASSLLRESPTNPRAVMSARMAIETFFKAYAGLKESLTEKTAKKMNHDLESGLDKMIELSGFSYLENLRPRLSIYPSVSERYKSQSMSKPDLWEAFQLAQTVGALVVRQFSDYNVLSHIEQS